MGFWDGSGISWTICKQSAPRFRQTTTPTPHHSIFTGRMLFLAPNQQCQSTEGKTMTRKFWAKKSVYRYGEFLKWSSANSSIVYLRFASPRLPCSSAVSAANSCSPNTTKLLYWLDCIVFTHLQQLRGLPNVQICLHSCCVIVYLMCSFALLLYNTKYKICKAPCCRGFRGFYVLYRIFLSC